MKELDNTDYDDLRAEIRALHLLLRGLYAKWAMESTGGLIRCNQRWQQKAIAGSTNPCKRPAATGRVL
jgi:hypothetical protein